MNDSVQPFPFVVPELWAALIARYERPFIIKQPTWWCWLNAKHSPPIRNLADILKHIGIPIPEAITALNWDAVPHTLSRAQLSYEIALARRDGRITKRQTLVGPEPATPEDRLDGIILWCLDTRRRRTAGFHKVNAAIKRGQKIALMTDIERHKFLSDEASKAKEAALKRGACKARRKMLEDLERLGQVMPRKQNGSYDFELIRRLLGTERQLNPPPSSVGSRSDIQPLYDPTLADV